MSVDTEAVFTALADPTRRRVLTLVAERGPASASTLAHHLPVSRQAIARHLAVLSEARLVRGERKGQQVQFGVMPETLAATAGWLAHVGEAWDARLERLRAYLAQSGSSDVARPSVG